MHESRDQHTSFNILFGYGNRLQSLAHTLRSSTTNCIESIFVLVETRKTVTSGTRITSFSRFISMAVGKLQSSENDRRKNKQSEIRSIEELNKNFSPSTSKSVNGPRKINMTRDFRCDLWRVGSPMKMPLLQ